MSLRQCPNMPASILITLYRLRKYFKYNYNLNALPTLTNLSQILRQRSPQSPMSLHCRGMIAPRLALDTNIICINSLQKFTVFGKYPIDLVQADRVIMY